MRRTRIPANGMTFDATEAGPPDAPLVVLLHGFPESSYEWDRVVPTLADAGYHVVAPDQRGYSPDARPEGVDAYHVRHLNADVRAIADHFGAERFHVVGHDWGALVAWSLAGESSERLRSLTALSVPAPGRVRGRAAERSRAAREVLVHRAPAGTGL